MDKMHSLEEVFNEWQNNTEFRKLFSANPKKALDQFGFKLSEEDSNVICETLGNKSHIEELEKRINK